MNLLVRDEKHGIITQLSSSETETMPGLNAVNIEQNEVQNDPCISK